MPKFIHTMIRVRDLEQSLASYDTDFNMKPSYRLDFDSFSLVYLRNDENDAEIELTWNKGKEEPYTHGDGYGPVDFAVDDCTAARERVSGLGYAPADVKEFRADDGSLLARYFFIQDPDGYKIEVLDRHGHYQ